MTLPRYLIPWESLIYLFNSVPEKQRRTFFLFYKGGLKPKEKGLGLSSWSHVPRLCQTRCLTAVSTHSIKELCKENSWLHLFRLSFPEGKQLCPSHSPNWGSASCLKPPLLLFSSYEINFHIRNGKLIAASFWGGKREKKKKKPASPPW